MKNKKLGLPYMGSKRRLSREIVDHILTAHPNTKYVWDLFGGGGAISFEFLQRPQIERVVYNELNTGVVELLRKIQKDGITPEFYQWVDRDTFNKHKNDDDWFGGLCKVVWSFGNSQHGYLFGNGIEQYKKEFHELVVDGIDHTQSMSSYCMEYVKEKYGIECDLTLNIPSEINIKQRRLNIRKQLTDFESRCKNTKPLKQLQHLQQLERLQLLERLEHLEQLQQLDIRNQSAFDVVIDTPTDETIIYLDPPYKGTGKYQEDVCHDELKRYIDNSPYTIYLSSYDFDLPVVKQMKHRSTLSPTKNNAVVEKLFCNKTEHKNTLF
mgnify:CR=1 FL=1